MTDHHLSAQLPYIQECLSVSKGTCHPMWPAHRDEATGPSAAEWGNSADQFLSRELPGSQAPPGPEHGAPTQTPDPCQ